MTRSHPKRAPSDPSDFGSRGAPNESLGSAARGALTAAVSTRMSERSIASRGGSYVAGSVISLACMSVAPTVRLAPESVRVAISPTDVIAQFRTWMGDGTDVVAAGGDTVVRRFSGQAGHFRYSTVEVVTFGPTWLTFEHLKGPFKSCSERYEAAPTSDGTQLTHTGTFALRGGLFTWPLARAAVKRAFEQHVRDHMQALRLEHIDRHPD